MQVSSTDGAARLEDTSGHYMQMILTCHITHYVQDVHV
jgi:hypothetical protein